MIHQKETSGADVLFRMLNDLYPLPSELRELLERHLVETLHKKNTYLLRQGDVNNHVHFIVSGFARVFYVDDKGKSHTTWFLSDNDFAISVCSFFNQESTAESIQLLDDTRVITLPYDILQGLYSDYPIFNYHGRRVTEIYYMKSEQRAVLLRTKSPEERFELLLQEYPHIERDAAHYHMASYLNISKEHFSRMQAQRIKKLIGIKKIG